MALFWNPRSPSVPLWAICSFAAFALSGLPQCTTSPTATKTKNRLSIASRSASPVQASTRQVRFDAQDPLFLKQPSAEGIKLVWISLDGLQRHLLEDFVKRQDAAQALARRSAPDQAPAPLHPFGIKALLSKTSSWKDLQISNPTITASSHTSTMTCASAGTHGIVANSQWNGEKNEGGFDKVHNTETFVQALRASGHSVRVSGYPGFDGRATNRVADGSVSYDSPSGKSQILPLSGSSDAQRSGPASTTVSVAIARRIGAPDAPPYTLTFELSENTDSGILRFEQQVIGRVSTDAWTEIKIDDPSTDPAGPGGRVTSQLASVRLFKTDSNAPAGQALSLYVSPTTQNRINPQDYAQSLDDRGLVFAAGKDYGLRSTFGDAAFLTSMEQNLRYFTALSHEALSAPGTDAVFLYFEDLDVLGHQYAGDLSALPIVDEHLRKFDQALGSVLARIRPETNVVIAGDHGMSAIQFELNAFELIPSELRSRFQIRSSGGSLFVYGSDPASLMNPPPPNHPEVQKLVSALSGATLPGDPSKKIFTRIIVRGSPEAHDAGWRDSEVALPWIFATVDTGIGIKTAMEPGLLLSVRKGAQVPPELLARAIKTPNGVLPEPVPLGQHGHASDAPDMITHLISYGPALTRAFEGVEQTKNLELVPRVADALGWPRPSSCATLRLP